MVMDGWKKCVPFLLQKRKLTTDNKTIDEKLATFGFAIEEKLTKEIKKCTNLLKMLYFFPSLPSVRSSVRRLQAPPPELQHFGNSLLRNALSLSSLALFLFLSRSVAVVVAGVGEALGTHHHLSCPEMWFGSLGLRWRAKNLSEIVVVCGVLLLMVLSC